ncbi:MAG: hypothetical protein C4560_10275 [Nitrospiraceae bacterium]|nr:MAG: hypothetical protein C4560_10275 [Nitrospiraceae bacterium]
MDFENIEQITQKISFAYEDLFFETDKRNLFLGIFRRYLLPVDPFVQMEPYDAIILLGREAPAEFEQMVKELKDLSLI